MSQLKIRTKGFDEVALNVESFLSPIFAAMNSSQTQSSAQHHPIRCQQPNIRFDVVFFNEREYEAWQTFIRNIQLKLLHGQDPNDVAVVTLWWPERDIRNWQGLIKSTDGGGQKFNWAPRTTVEVELVKGVVAQQAALFSFGTDFNSIFGGLINTIPGVDSLITAPGPALGQAAQDLLSSTDPLDQFLSSTAGASGSPGGSVNSLAGTL